MVFKLIIIAFLILLTSCTSTNRIYQISTFTVTQVITINSDISIIGFDNRSYITKAHLGKKFNAKNNQIKQSLCYTLIGFKDTKDKNAILEVSNYYEVKCSLIKTNIMTK